jgi:hypothetical protein
MTNFDEDYLLNSQPVAQHQANNPQTYLHSEPHSDNRASKSVAFQVENQS